MIGGGFKPIAIKCSKEQFKEVEDILIQHELISFNTIHNIDFYKNLYLVNNYNDDKYNFNTTTPSNKTDYNRTVFDKWDKDIFLQYCGIIIEDSWWWK